MKFSFVFGYRNRDLIRVKRCLDSLSKQTLKDFEVVFVDYGSEQEFATNVSELCEQYNFVNYFYNETRGMPWNRSHALNSGVRIAKGEYIIFGDVDLIYSINFVESVDKEASIEKNIYGECFHLPEHFNKWDQIDLLSIADFESFGSAGKGGVHIVHKLTLEKIGSYDEFYCFWGVEDRDLHWRLSQHGLREMKLKKQSPVFHQWHPPSSNFFNSNLPSRWWEQMNIYFEINKKYTLRNNNWGEIYNITDRDVLSPNFAIEIVDLKYSENELGKNGKAHIISIVFDKLRRLKFDQKIQFVYSNPPKKLYRNRFLKFSISKKLNKNIPIEDLYYIFWQIIIMEKRYDYFLENNENYIKVTFALKRISK